MNYVEELKWRGMLHDVMPGTEEQLNKEMTVGYLGIDPTADSLHIGHLVGIMLLKQFQIAGHKPVALIGGATGMIGDPSGKSQERNLLDEETLRYNQECIKKQLSKFLDFESDIPNVAVMVNNYDWMKKYGYLEFIRDVGKHITVNYMMAKDSVKKRLGEDAKTGMSYTEFSYQLVQGYDFLHLYRSMGCKIQMGGSDQWGNIVTGTELIRRKDAGEAFALTTQLIKKSDGTKFGKTEGGNIWLDAKRTSPYKFYQFWLNASDADAETYIKIFTLKTKAEIETLVAEHSAEPHLRKLQKALAEDITTRVHSKNDLERAIETTAILFGSSFEDFKKLSAEEVEAAFDETDIFTVDNSLFAAGTDPITILAEVSSIFPSKGEAKKNIQANAVSVNKTKITLESTFTSSDLLFGKFLLVQKGKKNYYLIKTND